MDLELKEFEEKINNITEQFMSLLDSNEGIEESVGNKFGEAPIKFDNSINGPTIFNTGNAIGGSNFKIGADDINFGGIKYKFDNDSIDKIPGHAIKFDSVGYNQLNSQLEDLYNVKKDYVSESYTGNSNIAFSDSNLRRAKTMNYNTNNAAYANYDKGNDYNNGCNVGSYLNNNGNNSSSYTNDKTCSTLNDKEVYEMSNNNGVENNGNPLYSFATIPAEKSLVEKRDWKDVLFMDIPWDTKIDIWGSFKKFCTAQIKITF